MSILLGSEIVDNYKNGKIVIEPYFEDHVGPNSLDVTLAKTLKTYCPVELKKINGSVYAMPKENCTIELDMKKDNPVFEIEIPKDGLVLVPGILYLGSTNEKAGSDYYVPMYEGRSSLARLGIQSHISAGFGDIYFKTYWTLEIQVVHPVKVYRDIRIGQIYFHEVNEEARKKLISMNKFYKGKYANQEGPQASQSFKDF